MSATTGTSEASGDSRSRRRAKRALVVVAVLAVLLGGAIVGGPRFIQANPDVVTNTVDWVRNIVGPGPVSAIENTYYRAVDVYDRWRYHATGQVSSWDLNAAVSAPAASAKAPGRAAVSVAGSAAGATSGVTVRVAVGSATNTTAPATSASRTRLPAAAPPQGATAQNRSASGKVRSTRAAAPVVQSQVATSTATSTPVPAPAFTPPDNVAPILAGPPLANEGVWQPLDTLGQPAGEPPVLWQTVIRPDPNRPYAVVALVAMDLSRSRVHVVPGTKEPASSVPDDGLRTGVIPADVQSGGQLLAAWNGGFKAIHGHYGMMTDGVVWLPAKDGMATAAIDDQGRLTIGAWGRGVDPSKTWAAWRQNNPPLIEDGVVNPDVIKLANTIKWGASLDGAVFIWRSGMGITQDGRWLIYAAGNSLSVQTLTDALQAAGTYNAMQLDVNMSFEHYVVFNQAPQTAAVGKQQYSLPISSEKLIRQMSGNTTLFLLPDERDFFYLAAR